MECILVVSTNITLEKTDETQLLFHPCAGVPLLERVIRTIASTGIRQFVLVGPESSAGLFELAGELADRADLEIRTASSSGDLSRINWSGPALVSSAFTVTSPRVIRRLLAAYQRSASTVTAVDFSAAEDGRIRFDKSRVAIGAGRVTAIGAKCGDGQCVGVSIVPDGQLLLAQLADLDTWSDIEPVVVAFQHGEIVEAVDISNLPWITVRDSTTLRKSEAVLMNSLRQSYDGWIASAIYRPISLRLSIQLAPLGISPTAMNVAAFMSFAGAGLLLATTSYANHLLAALLIQLSAVLDGCDGEIARLRYMDSKRGGYVDQLLDRYGDIVVVSGISVSYLSQHFSSIALVAAIMAGFTFSVSSYVTKEYKWFTDESVASRNLRNLRRRDLRNFVLGICILVGIAFWGMIAVAVLSHIVIFIIYCQAYMRLQNPKSGHDR